MNVRSESARQLSGNGSNFPIQAAHSTWCESPTLTCPRISPLGNLAACIDTFQVRRPIPIEKALEEDTLLAYAMNDEPLPADHGFPLRVLVPGWVGVASIKRWSGTCLSFASIRTFSFVEGPYTRNSTNFIRPSIWMVRSRSGMTHVAHSTGPKA